MSKWVKMYICLTIVDFQTFEGDKECLFETFIIKGNKKRAIRERFDYLSFLPAHTTLWAERERAQAQKTFFPKN